MTRPRFSLRVLLIVVTFAAIGLGAARLYLGKRLTTEQDAEKIKVGYSQLYVRYLLGPPRRRHMQDIWWEYDFQSKAHCFGIEFRNGRVIAVERRWPISK